MSIDTSSSLETLTCQVKFAADPPGMSMPRRQDFWPRPADRRPTHSFTAAHFTSNGIRPYRPVAFLHSGAPFATILYEPSKQFSRFLSVLENNAMSWILFILFGLVVGLIARALMPGRQPMGFILTAVLGMAGSFVGSYLAGLFRGGEGAALETSDPYNWIGAVLGSLLLLFVYGLVAGRKTTV
jgi:uncharacterized membrane protein YeaQ/YmgE (transglycosylase-associated protein family)